MKGLAKRVIACLDVRANDAGDLVVTKGDQYDVRDTDGAGREVRLLYSISSPSVHQAACLDSTQLRGYPLVLFVLSYSHKLACERLPKSRAV